MLYYLYTYPSQHHYLLLITTTANNIHSVSSYISWERVLTTENSILHTATWTWGAPNKKQKRQRDRRKNKINEENNINNNITICWHICWHMSQHILWAAHMCLPQRVHICIYVYQGWHISNHTDHIYLTVLIYIDIYLTYMATYMTYIYLICTYITLICDIYAFCVWADIWWHRFY